MNIIGYGGVLLVQILDRSGHKKYFYRKQLTDHSSTGQWKDYSFHRGKFSNGQRRLWILPTGCRSAEDRHQVSDASRQAVSIRQKIKLRQIRLDGGCFRRIIAILRALRILPFNVSPFPASRSYSQSRRMQIYWSSEEEKTWLNDAEKTCSLYPIFVAEHCKNCVIIDHSSYMRLIFCSSKLIYTSLSTYTCDTPVHMIWWGIILEEFYCHTTGASYLAVQDPLFSASRSCYAFTEDIDQKKKLDHCSYKGFAFIITMYLISRSISLIFSRKHPCKSIAFFW